MTYNSVPSNNDDTYKNYRTQWWLHTFFTQVKNETDKSKVLILLIYFSKSGKVQAWNGKSTKVMSPSWHFYQLFLCKAELNLTSY